MDGKSTWRRGKGGREKPSTYREVEVKKKQNARVSNMAKTQE